MTISVNFICGVMLGVEVIDAKILEEDVEGGTFLAIDLLIARLLIEW